MQGYESQRFLPPANEVCEGYVFTGVCLSTVGGMRGRGACEAGEHAWLGWACMAHTPLPCTLPRHAVNVRAVRILLECILVRCKFDIKCYTTPEFNS